MDGDTCFGTEVVELYTDVLAGLGDCPCLALLYSAERGVTVDLPVTLDLKDVLLFSVVRELLLLAAGTELLATGVTFFAWPGLNVNFFVSAGAAGSPEAAPSECLDLNVASVQGRSF